MSEINRSEVSKSAALHPDVLRALGLSSEDATPGNIAAHVYNVTQGGGLEGINLGWKGQEASTEFLCSIVREVGELWESIQESVEEVSRDADNNFCEAITIREEWESSYRQDQVFELAYSCVPVYTYPLIQAAIELGRTSLDDMDDDGLAGEVRSFEDIAKATLFSLALSIVDGLMSILLDNREKVSA